MKDEKPNVAEWKRKKKPISDKLNVAIKDLESVLDEINGSQKNLGKAREKVAEERLRLRSIKSIYDSNKTYLHLNPVTMGTLNIMTNLSEYEAANTRRLALDAHVIRRNIDSFLGTVNVVSSATASNMSSVTVHLAECMENKEAVLPFVEAIEKPSARDRRVELSSKLSAIETRFSSKLDGAWQTLQDPSKVDRFRQAATSARELISDLLFTLAPDDQVMAMEWFESLREDGKPTQRQRARFAMLGRNTSLGETELKPVYKLGKNIRNSYKELNKVAHLRKYEADLQGLTESLIDQCQVYLLKLLEIRKSYFTP